MTMWMVSLAERLAAERSGFRYQRKLMDAGGTEATAFDLLGYETGAACLALGNWHNAGPKGRVRAETVHLDDLEGLIQLCEAMVANVGGVRGDGRGGSESVADDRPRSGAAPRGGALRRVVPRGGGCRGVKTLLRIGWLGTGTMEADDRGSVCRSP